MNTYIYDNNIDTIKKVKVGDTIKFRNSAKVPLIINNEIARWKKIKVTCKGGKGGSGGYGYNTSGGPNAGEPGQYGNVSELEVELLRDDVLSLHVAKNGGNGSYGTNGPYSGNYTAGSGGGGGGATTFSINGGVVVAASGGKGGKGGRGYMTKPAYSGGYGGWGNPSGKTAGLSRNGGAGGYRDMGVRKSANSTIGEVIIEILEKYSPALIKSNNKYYTYRNNEFIEVEPTIENFENNSINLSELTTPTNKAILTMDGGEVLDDGKLYRKTIDISKYEIIEKIEVR